MTTNALTESTWNKVLKTYVEAKDPTIATLARMLRDILRVSDDDAVGMVFDAYGRDMLERQP